MKRFLVAGAAALGLTSGPALAAQDEPVKLTDTQLDEVTAGAGSLIDANVPINLAIQDLQVKIAIQNVPVNVGAAVQVNAIGQAIQSAEVTSFQQVAQMAAQ
jgi:hypothetical protein